MTLVVDTKMVHQGGAGVFGHKAANLVPFAAETPRFFCIPGRYHTAWRRQRQLPGLAELDAALNSTTVSDREAVLVRSSAVTEGLDGRGAYLSVPTIGQSKEVREAIREIWVDAETIDSATTVPLIVQRYICPDIQGHISNERRLTDDTSFWRVETYSPTHQSLGAFSLRAGQARKIWSDSQFELPDNLVAALGKLTRKIERRVAHLEWLWKECHLWVVQCDYPLVQSSGKRPFSGGSVKAGKAWCKSCDLDFLKDVSQFDSWESFPKVRSARIFDELARDRPRMWLTLGSALENTETRSIVRALDRLAASGPVVTRTDVSASTQEQLLPRSGLLNSGREILTFMRTAYRNLRNVGYSEEAIAFLTHPFIPALGSAVVTVTQDESEVRVDSIWGSPDGLLAFPHDSARVTLGRDGKARSAMHRVRHKPSFFAPAAGEWRRFETKPPWDWRASMREEQLRLLSQIGFEYRRLAGERRISLIALLCARHQGAVKSVLPFHAFAENIETGSSGWDMERTPARPVCTVSDWADLDRARMRIRDGGTISLTLSASVARDRRFLEAVAKLSRDNDATVVMQGSLLSHVYYTLVRNGVRVLCNSGSNKEIKYEW